MSETVPAKRQLIVETAYRLFKRDGIHATGIDKIIAEAGIAKMTMYRHFPSKDELIVAVLDWRAGRFEHVLRELDQSTETIGMKISRVFDWHATWFASPGFHGCLFQHALGEYGDPAHPVFKAVERQKTGLQRWLYRLVSSSMAEVEAQTAARALHMLIEGATLLAHLGQGDAAIADSRKAASLLLGRIGGRS